MMQNCGGHVTTDPEFQALRSMMQKKICEVLLTKIKPNPSVDWRLQLKFAKVVEENIFRGSHNMGNYIRILHNGVETWITDTLNKMKQTRQHQLHQEQQQLQQQNHHHSMTYHNIGSNSPKSCVMIPTPGLSRGLSGTGQVSLATERGNSPTDAAAGPHQPDSLLVQQHQSQGRLAQERQHIQKSIQQVTVNNNNSNSNFPLIEGVQAPSTRGTNKGSVSLFQNETWCLYQIKLILFLHYARSCPAPVGRCPEKNCGRVQNLAKHIEKCSNKQCRHPHCLEARKSFLHFRSCKAQNCPVCGPVKKVLSISKQKAVSLMNGLKGGVAGNEVNVKTETELLNASAMPAPDSSQPFMLSNERGMNQFDSSGPLIHRRDVSLVSIDLTNPQHQPHPPPQQPIMKRQRGHMDVFPVPTKESAEFVHSRIKIAAKLGPADSSQSDVKSSLNGVTPLCLPGIFSDQMGQKSDSVDLSISWHQPHLSPEQPLLKKPRVNKNASAVLKKTTNGPFSSAQEVCPTEKSANSGHAKHEMAVQIGAVESSEPVVKSSQNGVNLLNSSAVFSDQRDGASLLMDLSKGQYQPQLQPEQPLPKRPRINMDAAAILNNTTNPSFHAVEESFPSENGADRLHRNLQIDAHIGAVDSSQLGLKSSDKGLTQLDSSEVFPDRSDKEPNLVAVPLVLQLSHSSSQQSQPKRPILNVDTCPELVNAASVSSALQDTLPAEHCVNNADARMRMGVKINLVPENLEIAPGVCDTLVVHGDKCVVSASSLAQADVNPTNLSEDVHCINQKVSTAVENKESSDENGLKAIQERDKNLTAVQLENSNLKGVSMMECFTPEQVQKHIKSLSDQSVNTSDELVDTSCCLKGKLTVGDQNKGKTGDKGKAGDNSCVLCKGMEMPFKPRPIFCTPCGARIKRSVTYYMLSAGERSHATCASCYKEAKETIHIESHMVPKVQFEKKVNKEYLAEAWVQCDKCDKWQHQICALFNKHINNSSQAEYTCPNCYINEVARGERIPLPESSLLAARDLPSTRLSDFLENRLFRRLEIERHERASSLQQGLENVPGAEGLVVRVVSAADKRLEVKPRFYEIFQEENYPAEFTYRSKTILLFQNIDGVDVCLFAMYVHECGTDCALPNQRHVYISYLDSVKYFKPDIEAVNGEALRTFVYHEILIGYLEYCKKRGFVSCYIWVCPPCKGDDYIFYCHPKDQKTPKEDKLREWYLSMLKKGMRENIVISLTNLHDHFFKQLGESKAKVTAARLPYFDGDFWPAAAEDIINKMHQEENDLKQQKGKTRKNISIKRALKTASHTDISGRASKDAMLMKKLGEEIERMKENFIMVHLQHSCNKCGCHMVSGMFWVCNSCQCFYLCDSCHDAEQLLEDRERHPINSGSKHMFNPVKITGVPNDTKDLDDMLEHPHFNTRQAFLSLCQANHYQFDTLRRAKHSSMMVLYHLHNPTAPAFVGTCSNCNIDIESGQGWRCNVCPDFELCNSCYGQKGRVNHPHKLTNHPSSVNKDAEHQTARHIRG